MFPSLIQSLTITMMVISTSLAIPLQQYQESFQITSLHHQDNTAATIVLEQQQKIPSYSSFSSVSSYIETYIKLDDFYTTIVNQVLDSTLDEIIETAPDTYLTIHELQIIGREYCRSSVRTFMQFLTTQLLNKDQLKINLLVSIRPLLIQHYINNQDLVKLNTIMSQKLGLIINPNQLSHQIVQQLYPKEEENIFIWWWRFDKKWTQTHHHEKNELNALEAWLRSWLMDIEYILKDEFDSRLVTLVNSS